MIHKCSFAIDLDLINTHFDLVLEILNLTIYLDDEYGFVNENNTECFMNAVNLFLDNKLFSNTHPKILTFLGKGIDDLGNEVECKNTDLFANYVLLYVERKDKFMPNDYNLSLYLNRSFLFYGFCLPMECQNFAENLVVKINNKSKIKVFNDHEFTGFKLYTYGNQNQNNINDPNIIRYEEKNNNLLVGIFWTWLAILFIKLAVSYASKFFYPKGYEYHGYKLANEAAKDEDRDEDENTLFLDDIKNIDNASNLRGDYNPMYDLEPKYPLYLRIIKYLDLLNNLTILGTKSNRYYNDKNIDILCSLKSIVLAYVILVETTIMLIKLPNPSFFEKKFYLSLGLFMHRRCINGLYFWVLLESSTFSFKLMNFINKNIKNKETKRAQFNHIVKQILKFMCFYIPKILLFGLIYFTFYFLFDYYTCNLQSKMAYYYIYDNIIKKKECYDNPIRLLFPFLNYGIKYDYDKVCFPFVYVYTNMFYSSLLFMIILIIVFYFQKYILDIVISIVVLLNILASYIIFYKYFKDKQKYYTFELFSGENNSLFYPHLFFSIYYLGCLLGLCFYYYIHKINSLKRDNSTKSNTNSQSKDNGDNELTHMNSLRSSLSSYEKIDYYNLYCPMQFCSTLIIKMKSINNIIKIILIIVYLVLIAFLALLPIILLRNIIKDDNFAIEMKKHSYLYFIYYYEKLINVVFFFFFVCLLLVLPKRYMISKFFRSSIFNIISRAGFIIICIYQSLIYVSYCLFQLHVKISNIMIFNLTTGLYAVISVFAIIIIIFVEMPFRIIIKNLLKDDIQKSRKSKEILNDL
jgi:hypothetical protein